MRREDTLDHRTHVMESKGAQQIKEYCSKAAKNIGMNTNIVDWVGYDIMEKTERPYNLMIEIKELKDEGQPTHFISFSREEIEGYERGKGVEEINVRIKKELNELKDYVDFLLGGQ